MGGRGLSSPRKTMGSSKGGLILPAWEFGQKPDVLWKTSGAETVTFMRSRVCWHLRALS